MKKYGVFVLSLLVVTLAGCASQTIPDPEPTAGNEGADASAYNDDGLGQGEAIPDDTSAELSTVIYFDFDQAELKPQYVDLLARHAERIANGANVQVRLEGHADERGSREYNVGLGERRSQTVRRILIADGVSADRLATVSFGEERPVALGHNEQSYAQNRRVEIKYLN
jgi:peptidoglycan-associated lipoprotein